MSELWAVALISGTVSFIIVFAIVGGPALVRMVRDHRDYKAREKQIEAMYEGWDKAGEL
jgi:hypothetical protein